MNLISLIPLMFGATKFIQPVLTGYVAPGGNSFGTFGQTGTTNSWYLSDGLDTNDHMYSSYPNTGSEYFGLYNPRPVIVKTLTHINRAGGKNINTMTIQGSNDSTTGLDGTWTNLGSFSNPSNGDYYHFNMAINATQPFKWIREYATGMWSVGDGWNCKECTGLIITDGIQV